MLIELMGGNRVVMLGQPASQAVRLKQGGGRSMIRVVASFLLVLTFFAETAAQADDGHAAKSVVERLQSGVFGVLKQAKKLGVEGRYRQLLPVLTRDIQMTLMTATASGTFWRKGSKEQRKRAVKAFGEMHTALLAGLFDSYNGETFRTVRSRPTGGKIVLVDSEFFDGDGESTFVTFVTASIRGRWWVIDVIIANGISEVKVKMNEFRRLLIDGGLDNLSAALERKKQRLLSGEEKAKR
jgi:phospholipid transport system substrate-binding protein